MDRHAESLVPELAALLEKINSLEACDSSYRRAKELVEIGELTDHERFILSAALRRVARRETLLEAMRIVINDKNEELVLNYEDMTITPSKILNVNRAQSEALKKLHRTSTFMDSPAVL